MINVLEFGIIPDGYTCCVRALEQIISTDLVNGGILYFPPGKYALSRPLKVRSSNITFLGAGAGTSQFVSEDMEQSYLVFGSAQHQCQNFSVRDLAFNSYGTRTGGSYLHLCNVFNGSVRDCLFANGYVSLNLENTFSIRVDDCMIIDPTPGHGIGVLLHGLQRHSDQYLNRVFVQSQNQSAPGAFGFKIANSQGLWMSECGAYRCNTGFLLTATPGMTSEHFFLTRNHADTCTGDGWMLEVGVNARLRRVQFDGDWSSSNGNSGWTLRNKGGSLNNIAMRGPRAYKNTGPAIYAETVQAFDVMDATFSENSSHKDVLAEIVITEFCKDISIKGGRFGDASKLKSHAQMLLQVADSCIRYEVSGVIGHGYKKLMDVDVGNTDFDVHNTLITEKRDDLG